MDYPTIFGSAGSSLLIAYGFMKLWVETKITEKIKAEYAKELQLHKSRLDAQTSAQLEILRNDLSLQTKLIEIKASWVHQRGAEALLSIHEKFSALRKLITRNLGAESSICIRGEDLRPVREAFRDLNEHIENVRILIPDSLIKNIDYFINEFKATVDDYVSNTVYGNGASLPSWIEFDRKLGTEVDRLRKKLETQFKIQIGIHHPVTNSPSTSSSNEPGSPS